MNTAAKTYQIQLKGTVQGVGFRPFVYRLAQEMNMFGSIQNTMYGLEIQFTTNDNLAAIKFFNNILQQKPPHAEIISHRFVELEKVQEYTQFTIAASAQNAHDFGIITPDIAICEACIRDISEPDNRRYEYVFTTCSSCGPRYGILKNLPFDRENTSMKDFKLCAACSAEYRNPADRRFHAQTMSCAQCGPQLKYIAQGKEMFFPHHTAILEECVCAIAQGKILAVKGLGGFLLLCDAANQESIQTLRQRKNRPSKPLAVLFPQDWDFHSCFEITEDEEFALQSKEAPIVLLKTKANIYQHIAVANIAAKLHKIGVMKPSTAFLSLLSRKINRPLIATSANISGSPILYTHQDAVNHLTNIADIIISDDRELGQAQDDSVMQFVGKQRIFLRRGRGYAPNILHHHIDSEENIIAVGASMKSTFAVYSKEKLYVSQYLGNSESYESQCNFKDGIAYFSRNLPLKSAKWLCDAHPQYFTTQYAEAHQAEKIQHHQAHFAAVLAEHQLFEKQVLGVVFDGTGWGDDGHIWGGEFFHYQEKNIQRCATLTPFKQILGDKMSKEPRLAALSIWSADEEVLKSKFTAEEWTLYLKILKSEGGIWSHSMGRIFDAVASLLGLCDVQEFEGKAALYLESLASSLPLPPNPWDLSYARDAEIIDFVDTFAIMQGVLSDYKMQENSALIALKFQLTWVDVIRKVAEKQQLNHIACSGGVFQNALLVTMIQQYLKDTYQVYFHQNISPNDENISYGQVNYKVQQLNQNKLCV